MSQAGKKTEPFDQRLIDIFNSASLALMISLGHRTGLFDVMAGLGASTSGQIADRAGLNERYVREWLSALACGGIIEFETDQCLFHLPPERAAWLTRAAAPGNLAVLAQYFPVLGSVEDEILRCFKEGGGVSYSFYPRFHEVMAEDSGQLMDSSLYERILPLVPGLTERLEEGIEVLDLGCGRGYALRLMARRFPRSRFSGYDFSEEAIDFARTEADQLPNLQFRVKDLSYFEDQAEPDRFDLVITFDAVHDQGKPLGLLKGISKTVRRDGVYLMQDIRGSSHLASNLNHPIGALLYTVSCLHCMTVSLAQGGEGLGTLWGKEKALELLKEAGFSSVEIHELDEDIQNSYYIVRR